jgi:glutathionyl-hydroquinone reductase
MGLLVDGAWHDTWYDTGSTGGRFVRKDSAFRNWVTADGRPGPSGEDGFRAEPAATISTSPWPAPGLTGP